MAKSSDRSLGTAVAGAQHSNRCKPYPGRQWHTVSEQSLGSKLVYTCTCRRSKGLWWW
jgi:hypothetical protein